MDEIRERATNQFPMVLLTLLSIVQALALEFLWDHLRHRPELYEYSWIALLGWMQIMASLMAIILIWLVYTGMVMRFRWVPSMGDSIMPFFVGLIEFLMIDVMGTENFGRWLIVVAVVFSIMIVASHTVFRRARKDPANSAWFDNYSPAKLRDFAAQILIVATLVLLGILQWSSGCDGWLALCSLLAVHLVLAIETYNATRFWNQSMAKG
jgi:hypothetical protein